MRKNENYLFILRCSKNRSKNSVVRWWVKTQSFDIIVINNNKRHLIWLGLGIFIFLWMKNKTKEFCMHIGCVFMPCHANGRQRTFQEQKIIKRILCKTTHRAVPKRYLHIRKATIEIGILFVVVVSCMCVCVFSQIFRLVWWVVSVARKLLRMSLCVYKCFTLNSNKPQNMDKYFIITFGIRLSVFGT